jgi:hypothetical protein
MRIESSAILAICTLYGTSRRVGTRCGEWTTTQVNTKYVKHSLLEHIPDAKLMLTSYQIANSSPLILAPFIRRGFCHTVTSPWTFDMECNGSVAPRSENQIPVNVGLPVIGFGAGDTEAVHYGLS